MMLTLHDYQPSLNGWKVRVLLGLLGTPYCSREVALFQGESRSEAFLKLNTPRDERPSSCARHFSIQSLLKPSSLSSVEPVLRRS